MPGAVLHVDGKDFDPDSLLPSLALRPYQVYRRGEPIAPTGPRSKQAHESGGFSCEVSPADGLLSAEAADALAFLAAHRDDLARLRDHPAVGHMRIDFGYYQRIDGERVMVQCDYLSPELLRLAGELGVGFELSLYPPPGEPDAEPTAAPDC
jgi:hypothetical protein